MYQKHLSRHGHTRRFEIRERGGAWEVETLEDSRVTRKARYDDWHRVERALMVFRLEVVSLEQAGWITD
jgi:hypothetical protein